MKIQEEIMMIKLWDSGAYLIRGEELIADGADAAVQIKNKPEKRFPGTKRHRERWHIIF